MTNIVLVDEILLRNRLTTASYNGTWLTTYFEEIIPSASFIWQIVNIMFNLLHFY